MITDYASLQAEMALFLNRADLTAMIPTFIQLCEAQIRRRIKTKYTSTLSLTVAAANSGVETIPGDAPNEIISFYIVSPDEYAGPIDPTSPEKLWDHRRAYRFSSSYPRVATIIDQELLVSPLPDQDYDTELVIEGPLTALTDGEPTNYVLLNAVDVYLYGSLIASAPYLKDDARIMTWAGFFETALAQLEEERLRNQYPNTLKPELPQVIGDHQSRA